jgi:hypothetical protein
MDCATNKDSPINLKTCLGPKEFDEAASIRYRYRLIIYSYEKDNNVRNSRFESHIFIPMGVFPLLIDEMGVIPAGLSCT